MEYDMRPEFRAARAGDVGTIASYRTSAPLSGLVFLQIVDDPEDPRAVFELTWDRRSVREQFDRIRNRRVEVVEGRGGVLTFRLENNAVSI